MSEKSIAVDYGRSVPKNWHRFYSPGRGVYHFREVHEGIFEKRAVCGVSARYWYPPERGFQCFFAVHNDVAITLMLCTGCRSALVRWRRRMAAERSKQETYRPPMARYGVLAAPMLQAWRHEQRQLERWILANREIWDSLTASEQERG